MVEQSRLKPQHQGPEEPAARPYRVKAALPESQLWRKVPILWDGVIAHIRWYERKVRRAPTACIGASLQGEGSNVKDAYVRSDGERELGDDLNCESGMVTEEW